MLMRGRKLVGRCVSRKGLSCLMALCLCEEGFAMKLISTKCPSCGAQLDVDLASKKASCPSCGSLYLIDDDDRHAGVEEVPRVVRAVEEGKRQAQGGQSTRQANLARGPVANPPAKRGQGAAAAAPGAASEGQGPRRRLNPLWIVGWVFAPFVTAVVLLVRKKDLNPVARWCGIVLFGYLAVACTALSVYALGTMRGNEAGESASVATATKVEAPQSSSSLKGMHYDTVVRLFEEAGFTDIETKEDADLWIAVLHSDGDVEKVTVGGDSSFDEGDKFDSDDHVVIQYHTYRDKSKRESTKKDAQGDDQVQGQSGASNTRQANEGAFRLFSEAERDKMTCSEKAHYFINYYNSIAEHPFSEEGECATKDKESGHYRIEYLHTGYNICDNVVVYGTIDGFLAEFVTSGVNSCTLYIEVPRDEEATVVRVLPDAIRVFYDGVTNEQVQGAVDRLLQDVNYDGDPRDKPYYQFMEGANLEESQKTASGGYNHRSSENKWIGEHGDEWTELWLRRTIPTTKQ